MTKQFEEALKELNENAKKLSKEAEMQADADFAENQKQYASGQLLKEPVSPWKTGRKTSAYLLSMFTVLCQDAAEIVYFGDKDDPETGSSVAFLKEEHPENLGKMNFDKLKSAMNLRADEYRHIFLRTKDGEKFFLNLNEDGIPVACTEKPVTDPAEFMDDFGPKNLQDDMKKEKPDALSFLSHWFRNSWLVVLLAGKPKEADEVDRYNQAKERCDSFLNGIAFSSAKSQPAAAAEQASEKEKEPEAPSEAWFPGQDLEEASISYETPPQEYTDKDKMLDIRFALNGINGALSEKHADKPDALTKKDLYTAVAAEMLIGIISSCKAYDGNAPKEVKACLNEMTEVRENDGAAYRSIAEARIREKVSELKQVPAVRDTITAIVNGAEHAPAKNLNLSELVSRIIQKAAPAKQAQAGQPVSGRSSVTVRQEDKAMDINNK